MCEQINVGSPDNSLVQVVNGNHALLCTRGQCCKALQRFVHFTRERHALVGVCGAVGSRQPPVLVLQHMWSRVKGWQGVGG